MSQLAALKAATTIKDVAPLLGYEAKTLSYVLYKIPTHLKYTNFEIAKRYGGTRKISAPTEHLKFLQRRLSTLLQNCLAAIETSGGRKFSVSHGFRRTRSIITNAKYHRGRRYVFNIDLEDFFPSIHFGRVRGFFIKDKHFSLNEKVATILAQIACHDNALPQGSPCSPVISNLVGHVLDTHLVRLASAEQCGYTRYADDLTFSTNEPEFPARIAIRTDDTKHEWVAGNELAMIVARSGFKINPSKTRMQYRDSRQEVTGLVVNRKVNVRSEYRRMVRLMTHRLITKGNFEFARKEIDALGTKVPVTKPGKPQQLHGMLGFIDQIDLYNTEKAEEDLDEAGKYVERSKLAAKEEVYRRFLLFDQFYAARKPVVLCEGSTDSVYLVHAIRSLVADLPTLATQLPDGKIDIHIRLYRYFKRRKKKHPDSYSKDISSTGRILELSGGSGELVKFANLYREHLDQFKAPGAYQPVILLVDNDAGANGMFGYIKKFTHVADPKKEPFIHLFRNLYVVPTPLAPGEDKSTIEDFFKKEVTDTKIGGKFFSTKKKYDDQTSYGKVIFAHAVVKPSADKIDFSQFKELLLNISSVIEAHRKTHPALVPAPEAVGSSANAAKSP